MALGGQFIDVVEYVDDDGRILVKKYERPGDEIKQGARLIVREGQTAVFLRGGQLCDVFGPGTYKLNTGNLPILSSLAALPFGFNSPIKADLYFISMKQFIENKWGTKNPIAMRDEEFTMVRIRAFGTFSFMVHDPQVFVQQVLATRHMLKTYDIITYLTSLVTESAARVIGNANIPVLDVAVQYRNFAEELTSQANRLAHPLGLHFATVVIENISLPDEVEKLIDEQSGIGMAGRDMQAFMQYQSARAMRDAAKQEGGLAGLGAGISLGATMAAEVSSVTQSSKEDKEDPISKLKEYKSLFDSGILTQEEFEQMKKELLGL